MMARQSIRSPFGSLLDELREETVRNAAARPVAEAISAARRRGPEPDLHIETGIVSGPSAQGPRPWRWAATVVVHAVFVGALVTVPLLLTEELPAPASGTKVFFVQPLAPPPPPPPAAPARVIASAPRKETTPQAASPRLAAPVAAPAEIKPEDLAPAAPIPAVQAAQVDEGVPGGVDEGVPGGIVGGVLEPAAHRETTAPPSHVRVGGEVKEPRKIKHVNPAYPEVAARGKIEGVVLLELSIRPDGRVEDVRVLRSIPLLDAAAMAAARQWVFSPTLLGGVPVGVTMSVSVRFSLTQAATASF